MFQNSLDGVLRNLVWWTVCLRNSAEKVYKWRVYKYIFCFSLVGCKVNVSWFSHSLRFFLWHLKGERNIRLVMKLTSPELDQGETPSNKVGLEKNQFLLKQFGHIITTVTWCLQRNFILVDPFKFYYLIHFPGQYTHTHTQSKETPYTTQWGRPEHQSLTFLTDAFVDSVLIVTLQLLVYCMKCLWTSRKETCTNTNFCNYNLKNTVSIWGCTD